MKISIFIIILLLLLNIRTQAQVIYQYDNHNRLIKADFGNGSVINYTYDANGNMMSKIVTGISLPMAPLLATPANNSTGNLLSLLFDWNDAVGASSYHFQISNSLNFATILLDTSGLSTSQFNLTANILNPLTIYYWRVNAINIAGSGNFSEVWNFKTLGTPVNITLLNPANNSINQPVNINFVWKKGIDQTALTVVEDKVFPKNISVNKDKKSKDEALLINKYWLEMVNDTISMSNVIRDSSIIDTTKSLSGLTNSSNYFWRVKAKNEIGWGGFSSWFKFTTIIAAPVSPQLLSPLNGSIGNQLSLTLQWRRVTGADTYRIQLSTDSLFSNLILNDSTLIDSNKIISGLNPLTNYYWRISAKNIGGVSSFSQFWKFKTIGTPVIVTLVSPINNTVNQPVNTTFVWRKSIDQTSLVEKNNSKKGDSKSKIESSESIETISKYSFQLTTDTVSLANTINDSTLTDTIKTVAGLNNQVNYFWHVRAKNEIGWGQYSGWFKFTTIVAAPVSPSLALPLNGSTNLSPALKLDWNTVLLAASYRVQIATDSLFTVTTLDSTVTVDSLNLAQGILLYNQKYFWRVNSSNIGGTSSYSPTWNFTTIQNLPLSLKAYLEGFWNGSTMVPDTISVYLAKSIAPFSYIDSAKVIITTNGTVPIVFTKAANDNYYIVVKHRNHFETWSKLPQTFATSVTVSYDFTSAANKAYGDNLKQFGSVWVIYGGDANYDGSIDGQDVPIFINQFGTQGYLICDFNGDGDVNASDVAIISGNFGYTKATPVQNLSDGKKSNNVKTDIERNRKEILDKLSKSKEADKKNK